MCRWEASKGRCPSCILMQTMCQQQLSGLDTAIVRACTRPRVTSAQHPLSLEPAGFFIVPDMTKGRPSLMFCRHQQSRKTTGTGMLQQMTPGRSCSSCPGPHAVQRPGFTCMAGARLALPCRCVMGCRRGTLSPGSACCSARFAKRASRLLHRAGPEPQTSCLDRSSRLPSARALLQAGCDGHTKVNKRTATSWAQHGCNCTVTSPCSRHAAVLSAAAYSQSSRHSCSHAGSSSRSRSKLGSEAHARLGSLKVLLVEGAFPRHELGELDPRSGGHRHKGEVG